MEYWDYLGWRDRFGSKDSSDRQRRYARAWKARGLVTPQFVIAGRAQRLAAGVLPAVDEEAARQPTVAIEATARLSPPAKDLDGQPLPRTVEVDARLRRLGEAAAPPEGAILVAALVQREATTECTAGENAGATLREFFVVRALSEPMPVGEALRAEGARATLPVPSGLRAPDLTVALLLEDPVAMRTLECRALPVEERKPEKG